MHQILFNLPVFVLVALLAGLLAAMLPGPRKPIVLLAAGLGAALLAGTIGYIQHWNHPVPVRGYGTMILAGFLLGMWMGARRAHLIGCEKRHVMDVAIYGVIVGLAGARIFHVLMNWGDYTPFTAQGFSFAHIGSMFALWEGGLVFYGAFLLVIPWAWAYCRANRLPALKFLDLTAPSLIVGLALGRVGCFLNGCCFGKVCALPWGVSFPADSPAWQWQVADRIIPNTAAYTLPVHPTQIYACIAAALTAGFLYAFWPRRKFDGQIVALMMIMAGAMRFFEELLRDDEAAVFPHVSDWMTIAQWVALVLVAGGFALLLYFRARARHAPARQHGNFEF